MELGEGSIQVMSTVKIKEPVNRTFGDVTTSVLEAQMSYDEDNDKSDTESGAERAGE